MKRARSKAKVPEVVRLSFREEMIEAHDMLTYAIDEAQRQAVYRVAAVFERGANKRLNMTGRQVAKLIHEMVYDPTSCVIISGRGR